MMDYLFDALITTKEVGIGLLVSEFSLFRRLAIPMKLEVAPLEWWKENACRLPKVGFLATKFLAIPGSQIETECNFSIV